MRRIWIAAVVSAVLALGCVGYASASPDAIPAVYKNCTNFNKKYPHGVGKATARDNTKSATAEPVRTFKRSTRIYNEAMKHNKRLDGDKDGVACEKK